MYHFRLKWKKIYGMHKLMGLQLFWSGTPTFCQMGVLNSCFQNPSESSHFLNTIKHRQKNKALDTIIYYHFLQSFLHILPKTSLCF